MFDKIKSKSKLFTSPQTGSVFKIIFQYEKVILCFREVDKNTFRVRINYNKEDVLNNIKSCLINSSAWSDIKDKDHISITTDINHFHIVISDAMFGITKYFSLFKNIKQGCEKFDLEEFKSKKFIVHCETEVEAQTFLIYLHDSGFSWASGETLMKNTNWSVYKKRTYYSCWSNNYIQYGNISLKKEIPMKLFSQLALI